MDVQWTPPEIVELTLEEAMELTDLEIVCAGTSQDTASQDYQ